MQRALPFPRPSPLSVCVSRHRAATLTRALPAVVALALGVLLRALLLNQPGLHPDEALYASWALRIADGSDPALLGVYVDKPPLLLYLLAGLFRLAGFDGQTPLQPDRLIVTGRLAALLASGISLALLWLIAHRLHGPRVAIGALALFALSPLAVRLSPTLFTDPWLTLWLLLGLWAALGRRPWLAGIACGFAYATKQQALLFLPLLLAVLLLSQRWPVAPFSPQIVAPRRLAWRWLNGFAIVAVAVLWWDSLRWQWMPSYWDRSAQTYGGLALALDAGLPQRLAQWGELLGYGFIWPLWLAVAALVLWALSNLAARRLALRHGEQLASRHAERAWHATRAAAMDQRSLPTRGPSGCPIVGTAPVRSDSRWLDALLLAYVAGYLLLHIATNLAPWDRYLLPLLPLLALLLAHAAFWAWDATVAAVQPAGRAGWVRRAASAGLVFGLLYAVFMASFARLPLGDGGAYDGVQQVAAHMRSAEPSDVILYHHWLGWHYNFYLYDAAAELRWWQDPADLAYKAAANSGQRQIIAFPAGRGQEAVQAALAAVGMSLSPVLAAMDPRGAPSVTLYSIEPALAGALAHGR